MGKVGRDGQGDDEASDVDDQMQWNQWLTPGDSVLIVTVISRSYLKKKSLRFIFSWSNEGNKAPCQDWLIYVIMYLFSSEMIKSAASDLSDLIVCYLCRFINSIYANLVIIIHYEDNYKNFKCPSVFSVSIKIFKHVLLVI